MTRPNVLHCSAVALVFVAMAACARPVPPLVTSPGIITEAPGAAPSGLLGEPVDSPEVEVAHSRAVDPLPRERWESPFAVSANGRVEPVQRRRVIVIDADPAIAAGLEEQGAIELEEARRRQAPATTVRPAAPPAPAPAPTPARAAQRADESTRLHLVQRGDTWYGIANRYRVPSRALAEANPGIDPERIRIGQTLIIPRTD